MLVPSDELTPALSGKKRLAWLEAVNKSNEEPGAKFRLVEDAGEAYLSCEADCEFDQMSDDAIYDWVQWTVNSTLDAVLAQYKTFSDLLSPT